MSRKDLSNRQNQDPVTHMQMWSVVACCCAILIGLLAVNVGAQWNNRSDGKGPLARFLKSRQQDKEAHKSASGLDYQPQNQDLPPLDENRKPRDRQQESTCMLRVAWGGGTPQAWQGLFEIDRGSLGQMKTLGFEADEPCGFAMRGRTIFIQQPSPRTYDGFDIPVYASRDARVIHHLTLSGDRANLLTQDDADKPQVDMPLHKLASGRKTVTLDMGGNRLTIRRAPGDKLRVRFDRPSLVFKPGEEFRLAVKPHWTGVASGTETRLDMTLSRCRGGKVLRETSREIVIDAEGGTPDYEDFTFKVPEDEGVYDVRIKLTEESFTGSLLGRQPVTSRMVQLVVIAPEPQQHTTGRIGPPRTIDEVSPGKSESWWSRLTRLPELKDIPGFGQGVLSHGKVSIQTLAHREFVQLGNNAWQAFPLSIEDINAPHILEVEYPENYAQTLGISVIEPNASGGVSPLGVASGIRVQPSSEVVEGGVARHRIIFWPRTTTPLVLLTNRGSQGNALFGTVRVLRGSSMLSSFDHRPHGENCRKAMAYFDKPLFAENFSSSERLDLAGGRGLDDWQTFYLGGARLLDYLEYVGFDGAVIPAFSEGAALYPSQILVASPKYDTGVFFASGQDPVTKDVMEMLLRMFTAQGKTLAPSFQFASPLSELEQMILASQNQSDGILLLDGEGRTFHSVHGRQRGMSPCYNPLDDRVQRAVLRVIDEFVERYSRHPSFGGITLRLSSESYLRLPAGEWGCDQRTITRFEKETGRKVPAQGKGRTAWLKGAGRDVWQQWRAQQLAQFHKHIHFVLSNARPEARLYMAPADSFQGRLTGRIFQPQLTGKRDVNAAILETGLDLSLYKKTPGIVWLRPRYATPILSPLQQGSAMECNDSPQVDRIFRAVQAGSLFVNEPQPVVAPKLGEASIFKKQPNDVFMMSHFSQNGESNRRRFIHALATMDSSVIFEGGWMMPLGQEESLRPLLDIYRRLPALPFKLVELPVDEKEKNGRPSQSVPPVVVRTLSHKGRTFIYLVNNSPWPVIAKVTFKSSTRGYVESLDRSRETFPLEKDREGAHWRVTLTPYSLMAGTLTSPDATVVRFSADLPHTAITTLEERIRIARLRAVGLKHPSPYDVLSNPDFEVKNKEKKGSPAVPGWVFTKAQGATITTDSQGAYRGNNSIRIESDGPIAWLRSDAFETPRTGRIAIRAWIRADGKQKQSPLRIAIEGRIAGRPYYRFATIGTAAQEPIESKWTPYVFQLDDLPPGDLDDLRVGFDLCGPGRIWVDDVRIFDLAFTPVELGELSKMLALADYHLRRGKVGECLRIMSGYWPQYLDTYVPMPELHVAERDENATKRPSQDDSADTTDPTETEVPRSASMYDRIKGYIPGSSWF